VTACALFRCAAPLIWQDFRRLGAEAHDESRSPEHLRLVFQFLAFPCAETCAVVIVRVQADAGARSAKVTLETPPISTTHEADLAYLGLVLQVASSAAHRARERLDFALAEVHQVPPP
jgi:hypothetical protein